MSMEFDDLDEVFLEEEFTDEEIFGEGAEEFNPGISQDSLLKMKEGWIILNSRHEKKPSEFKAEYCYYQSKRKMLHGWELTYKRSDGYNIDISESNQNVFDQVFNTEQQAKEAYDQYWIDVEKYKKQAYRGKKYIITNSKQGVRYIEVDAYFIEPGDYDPFELCEIAKYSNWYLFNSYTNYKKPRIPSTLYEGVYNSEEEAQEACDLVIRHKIEKEEFEYKWKKQVCEFLGSEIPEKPIKRAKPIKLEDTPHYIGVRYLISVFGGKAIVKPVKVQFVKKGDTASYWISRYRCNRIKQAECDTWFCTDENGKKVIRTDFNDPNLDERRKLYDTEEAAKSVCRTLNMKFEERKKIIEMKKNYEEKWGKF